MRTPTIHGPTRARGAALVIALLLLVVMTLLAVAGMNSASLEFVMAGNDQFHENAFQASETGIQAAIANGVFNPSAAPVVFAGAVPNSATDTYAANIVPQLGGAALPATNTGSSWAGYAAYHFEIQSAGSSLRTSSALHNQGVQVLSPPSPSWQPNNPGNPVL